MITYTLTFSPTEYTIKADGRSTSPQVCKFGPVSEQEAAYMTLITGLSDLLVRIQKADKLPFSYGVEVVTDFQEVYQQLDGSADGLSPKLAKLHGRAWGLMKRFGVFKLGLDTEEETGIMVGN